MKHARFQLLTLLFLAVPAVAFAQPKPSPEAARDFLAFYYDGQGRGVVLADTKICAEIVEYECADAVAPAQLKTDTPYHLWMTYVVPQGEEVDDLIVQFNQGGLTRFTREAAVKGSVRYRTWRTFSLNNAGDWEVKILQDHGDRVETLRSLRLKASE